MGSTGQILLQHNTMSPQDQITFRRWLRLNAVVGFVMAAGLVGMALVGSNSSQSAMNTAAARQAENVTAFALPNAK
jgi:hypothetical protein